MARIEKGGDVQEQLSQMHGEIMQTVRRRSGRGRAIGCAVAGLAALLLALIAAGWVVAATGLAQVPLLTGAAYRVPQPAHAVIETEPIETYVSRALSDLLGTRLRQGNGTLSDRRFSLVIPEGTFTASLRDALGRTDQNLVDAGRSQAAVTPDGLELFLPLKDNRQGSALVLTLRLSAANGSLDAAVREVRVGSLAVPGPVTEAAFAPAVRQSLLPFTEAFGRYATLTGVSSEAGAIRFTGELSVSIIDVK
ncbi:hypothetical protein EPO34_04185 [Patescibacteria group bacterium]|nr:MAG: hypothetical protein EPO34_04185 [Patescibacteria group bacterium]